MTLAPRRSLRTQLVLWNVLALALLFAALGVVVRYAVQSTILASVDRELERRTGPPGGGPPDHGGGHNPLDGGGGPPDGADNPPDGDRGGPFGRHGPPPNDRDPYHPILFTAAGRPFRSFDTRPAWDSDALKRAARGQTVYSDVTVNDVPLRVLSRPFGPPGNSQGVVQAAYPLTDVQRAMAGLDRALLGLIPVALLCAGLAGAFLTDRVLRRVRLMTQAAGGISARNFSERLPVTGEDEFAQLAETFNAMLGRLQSAFEQQRRFTADASHELKTPLTIIKGNTSMTLTGRPAEAEYRQSLQEIDGAADTMGRLVQDLLLLARSDSGQLGRSRRDVPVREALELALARLPRRACAPVRLDGVNESLRVSGNGDELVRLFANLLDNAVRYTPKEGQVLVAAHGDGQNAVITVTDTGPGIAPEHLPHLGERFYRVDSARSRPDGGTGLGLSICRGIVEAHGGAMTFTGEPGVGTTVRVTLPSA